MVPPTSPEGPVDIECLVGWSGLTMLPAPLIDDLLVSASVSVIFKPIQRPRTGSIHRRPRHRHRPRHIQRA